MQFYNNNLMVRRTSTNVDLIFIVLVTLQKYYIIMSIDTHQSVNDNTCKKEYQAWIHNIAPCEKV